jgi:hypothetical protein
MRVRRNLSSTGLRGRLPYIGTGEKAPLPPPPNVTLTDDSHGLINCMRRGDSVNAVKHIEIKRADERTNLTLYL